MFKRTQARNDWRTFKQHFPEVEGTPGFVKGFGQRLDDADSKGKATISALEQCEPVLKGLVAALDAEIASLTTLAFAVHANADVVKKADTANPGKAILRAWNQFVSNCDLNDAADAAVKLKELRKKADDATGLMKTAHGLYTRG
ncbi:MAG: hypothetical protein JST11_12210 [Acidobacteria bacterium]|nr:hypothetical protein [Acidobacteriota bacterium]